MSSINGFQTISWTLDNHVAMPSPLRSPPPPLKVRDWEAASAKHGVASDTVVDLMIPPQGSPQLLPTPELYESPNLVKHFGHAELELAQGHS